MKKLLLSLLTLIICAYGFSQNTPVITMIMDGDCAGGNPKVVEIYAQGTVDFSNYSLENQTNANTTWDNTFDLSPLGTVTNGFVYIYKDDPSFATEFPSVTAAQSLSTTSSVMSFNGDDRIRIINTVSSAVIDQYGQDGIDGSGTAWEYTNGYAKRLNNTGPDGATFTEANWNFYKSGVDGLCGTSTYESIAGAGSYTFSTSPTVQSSASTVSGFVQFVGTPSNPDSINVSGINLTADVDVAVSTGDYEISLTKNSGYASSVIVPQTGGTAASTKVYIRLNGIAAANPSNGTLTLSSAGATDVTVNLEGVINNPAPSIVSSEDTITGFSHFVGTPSSADSFNVDGYFLTGSLDITAPTNFEVSTDNMSFSSSVSLTPTSGSVPTTKIYVRLNGPVMNLNQMGSVVLTSTGVINDSIYVAGETLDYIPADIDTLKALDGNGVSTHKNQYVSVTGVVYCEDFRSYPGYDLTIIDGTGAGINIFSTSDINNYVATEGDKITVKGIMDQYNGLIELKADTIILVSQNNPVNAPTVVTSFDESIESQFIELDNLTTVNGEAVWPDGGNVDVTDGVNTYQVRVPSGTAMANAPIPAHFKLTGIGKQYDGSSPYDSGYQVFPCSVTDICNIDNGATATDGTITATQSGASYQWYNCDDDSAIAGETSQTFSPAQTGNYYVVITDGVCTDTSACVLVDFAGVVNNDFAGIKIYPNPMHNQLQIVNTNNKIESVEITSATGKVIYSSAKASNEIKINTSRFSAGVYFVKLRTMNSEKTFKAIK